ncbi:MAG: GNAT family N-acetyltransferase [Deltaproteobacteria bacterium]|nr:GNAT family N-acetyltransferase [Deltaproteobacteria bacterium]
MCFLQVFRLPKRIEGQGVCLAARPRPLWRLLLTPLSQGRFTLEFVIRLQGGERVGQVEVRMDTQGLKQAEIGMEVDPAHRSQGLGRRALQLIESYLADTLGVETATVRVREDNSPSRAFAEQAGYRMAEHDPNGMIHFKKRIGNST